jgi:transcriptional regulator of NAD metabolism
MTPNYQRIKDAISKHCLDTLGNVYTITLDDVMDYIEKELSPNMKVQLDRFDEESFAVELADAIGNTGIMELMEGAICEAIKTQTQYAREAIVEALTESGFLEAQL